MIKDAKFWFRLAYRGAIAKYPCLICRFVLATHGRFDAAFGIGMPLLCSDHATEADGEDWRLVSPDIYDEDTQAIINELGDRWYLPKVP
jgi:hypothetical protein